MARLPPRSTREVEGLLHHFGLRLLRGEGRHNVWGQGARGRNVAVPRARGPGEMKGGTVRAILREAGIPIADALEFWGIRPR